MTYKISEAKPIFLKEISKYENFNDYLKNYEEGALGLTYSFKVEDKEERFGLHITTNNMGWNANDEQDLRADVCSISMTQEELKNLIVYLQKQLISLPANTYETNE